MRPSTVPGTDASVAVARESPWSSANATLEQGKPNKPNATTAPHARGRREKPRTMRAARAPPYNWLRLEVGSGGGGGGGYTPSRTPVRGYRRYRLRKLQLPSWEVAQHRFRSGCGEPYRNGSSCQAEIVARGVAAHGSRSSAKCRARGCCRSADLNFGRDAFRRYQGPPVNGTKRTGSVLCASPLRLEYTTSS